MAFHPSGLARRTRSAVKLAARRRRQLRAELAERLTLAAKAGTGLVAATVALHITAGLLPLVFMVGVGVALRSLAGGDGLPPWLVAACLAFIAAQLVTPLQRVASQAIARRVDAYCSLRITGFALGTASPALLEQAGVADKLSDANEALDHIDGRPFYAGRQLLTWQPVTPIGQLTGPADSIDADVARLIENPGRTAAQQGDITMPTGPAMADPVAATDRRGAA